LLAGFYTTEHDHFRREYRLHMYKDAKKDPQSEAEMRIHLNLKKHMIELLRKRRFTVTTNGLFALVPSKAKPGDVVAVLVGGVVPFVLRKKERQRGPQSQSDGLQRGGPESAGTSRRPDSPLIVSQKRRPRGRAVEIECRCETPVRDWDHRGSEVYHPSWEVIGTAYVHGIMHGEVKDKYEAGEAVLQTFLLV
jgi:hypothetical protein